MKTNTKKAGIRVKRRLKMMMSDQAIAQGNHSFITLRLHHSRVGEQRPRVRQIVTHFHVKGGQPDSSRGARGRSHAQVKVTARATENPARKRNASNRDAAEQHQLLHPPLRLPPTTGLPRSRPLAASHLLARNRRLATSHRR